MKVSRVAAYPYAKAVFNLALESGQLEQWRDSLQLLAQVAVLYEQEGLLNNPKIASDQKVDFFAQVASQTPQVLNLVKLLVERRKLTLLPDIADDYRKLFLAHHNILEVKIVAAHELTEDQKGRLSAALNERYHNKIVLQCSIEPTLIGGAVMYVGDQVIDHSAKGMLQRLKASF